MRVHSLLDMVIIILGLYVRVAAEYSILDWGLPVELSQPAVIMTHWLVL